MIKTIYTVNLNNYDTFKEPAIITPGWNYIYYTNDKSIKSNVWEVVHIDTLDAKEARRLKIFNPYQNNDISIWIDSSMLINCNLDEFVKKYAKADFNLMTHPDRNCIYKEAEACIKRKKDNEIIIKRQIEKYRHLNYPENNGMVATGILIRKNSASVIEFCKKWWNEVRQHSRRDQISFNFVNWHNPIDYYQFPFEVLKNEFILNKHNK